MEIINFFKKYQIDVRFFKETTNKYNNTYNINVSDIVNNETFYDGATNNDILIMIIYILLKYDNITFIYESFDIVYDKNQINVSNNFFDNLLNYKNNKRYTAFFVTIDEEDLIYEFHNQYYPNKTHTYHTNIFIIDSKLGYISRFDSNGPSFYKKFDEVFRIFFNQYLKLQYTTPDFRFQIKEVKEYKNEYIFGHCTLWSLFYLELIILDYDPYEWYNKILPMYGFIKFIKKYAINFMDIRTQVDFKYIYLHKFQHKYINNIYYAKYDTYIYIINTILNNHSYNTRSKNYENMKEVNVIDIVYKLYSKNNSI